MKDPAFLLYSKDFIAGTQDLSVCEVGAYLRLLLYQHQHGSIPNNVEKMMRICGVFDTAKWAEIWNGIKSKFTADMDNQMVNHRLNHEMNQRATAKPKKIAAATLAGLISANDLSPQQIQKIKQIFDIQHFIEYPLQEIKEKIKKWFYNMVNQMVNNIVDVDVNVNANVNREIKKGVENDSENLRNEAAEIILYYCEMCQKDIPPNHYHTQQLIIGLLLQGYSADNIRHVVELKAMQALKNEFARKWLNPSTLFGPKFVNYHNEVIDAITGNTNDIFKSKNKKDELDRISDQINIAI